jgi:hypothetical protein
VSERERVEEEIRVTLATETHAIPLSNRLFNQEDGLFGRLAHTEEERRAIAQSPLFLQAMRRLSELRAKEVAEFRSAVQRAENAFPDSAFQLKVDQPPRR